MGTFAFLFHLDLVEMQPQDDVVLILWTATVGKTARFQERVTAKVGVKVGEKVGERLTANQDRIINLLNRHPAMSARDLSVRVGISARKIEDNLAKLKAKGLLRRIGPDKGGHWEILSP